MQSKNVALFSIIPAIAAAHAQAALPTGTEAVFTGLATDFGTLLGYGMVLLLVITGGMAVVGLIKRVVRKTAS